MRPTRLELSGFTAFREPVEIDFAGADLFALVGATGSGKSSVIDAMCFALYGCVPRYGDRRLVAPAISQGKVEARVRLDFTVGGADYTAVRVVRRTKGGATTPEARLQHEDEVLASGADEVTAAVESLLGLTFDHFTTCVVLPQGEFARFLHDKARDRQQLLANLLELTIYDEMGRAARQRAKEAANKRELLDDQLARLAFATTEAKASTEARIAELAALKDLVEREQPVLDALAAAAADARRQATDALARADQLEWLKVPPSVAQLAAEMTAAATEREEAAVGAAAAEAALHQAEEAEAVLGSAADLERARDAHEERSVVAARIEQGEDALAGAIAAAAAAARSVDTAEAAEETARAVLAHAQLEHRAQGLAAELTAGEPCPVCHQVVTALPQHEPVPDLEAAREAAEGAAARLAEARRAAQVAEAERARVEEKLAGVRERWTALDAAVASHPDREAVVASLVAVTGAREAVAAAREADRAARRRLEAAAAVDGLRRRESEARQELDRARDAIAALGPPPLGRDDLASDWAALVDWATSAAPAQRETAASVTAAAEEAETQRRALGGRLIEACRTAGVPADANLRDACVEALLRAEHDLTAIEKALAERAEVEAEAGRLREREQVASTLGRHLDAKGFEKWVLDEALDVLVAGATGILRELSAGQYSLALDAKTSNFMVIDHRNADELRSARTLSGGETFLASLALALSLAEMTARGAAQLDAIFLDEGFGTLDADTLDTVAAAIEELGAQGRMVGLVSHVRELADRMPVRFEVTKGPGTSTVARIS